VEAVKGAVVNLEVKSQTPAVGLPISPDPNDDSFERFFGVRPPRWPRRQPLRQGLGSGFIIDAHGLALTNNHVVEGAVSILVRLNDGRSFEGTVLGRDPLTDVALVKLNWVVDNLPTVPLGNSDKMRVGDWVLAIGNPFGLASSVSLGILSAKARNIRAGPYDDFLQTDAAINPGNSGGPLFNMSGEVIGINSAIAGMGSGIGFALPSNLAKGLLPQLENDGRVTRGWLGIGAQDETADLAHSLGVPVTEGAVIVEVNEGAPAKHAGLQSEDVIVAIDGQKISAASSLSRTVSLKRPGTEVLVSFYRGPKKEERKIELATRPDLEGVGSIPRNQAEGDKREERIGLIFEDLGPSARRANETAEGALITEVQPGSLGDRANLVPGMVVVEAGGKRVKRAADLKRAIREAKPGTLVLLRVEGSGKKALRALPIPD
jgi:serine protease Do